MLLESRSIDISQGTLPDGSFHGASLAPGNGGFQVEVGLVNNMPDAALKQTERQFGNLLVLGAGERFRVKLHFLALGGVARGAEALAYMRGRYVDVADAAALPLDALIVTGAEPRAKSLRDEPYWSQFANLMDWAERNTFSTICSCLAAHAAVLHFDQVERHAIGFKRSGVFESETEGDHSLLRDLPSRVAMPHSRYNELREDELRGAGYRILTKSPRAGVDMFMQARRESTFLFFQGHPEYESGTLLREYRRDLLRYLKGERDVYPIMPCNYFEADVERRLARFETRAKARRSPDLASDMPLPGEEARNGIRAPRWAAPATVIYRNWLDDIVAAKLRAYAEWSLVDMWCAE